MKKGLFLFLFLFVISLSLMSAFSFSDFWARITGHQISGGGNLIENGNFDVNYEGWSVYNTSEFGVVNGVLVIRKFGYAEQSFDIVSGVVYNVSFLGYNTGELNPRVEIRNTQGTVASFSQSVEPHVWKVYSFTFSSTSGERKIRLTSSINPTNNENYAFFENVSIIPLSAVPSSCSQSSQCNQGIGEACINGVCTSGKSVAIYESNVNRNYCGVVQLECVTNALTNSLVPYWNFSGSLLSGQSSSSVVSGRYYNRYNISVSNGVNGNYQVGCFLDSTLANTDLNISGTNILNKKNNVSTYSISSCSQTTNIVSVKSKNIYPFNSTLKNNAISQCSNLVLELKNTSGSIVANFSFDKSSSSELTVNANVKDLSLEKNLSLYLKNSCCLNKDVFGDCKNGSIFLEVDSIVIGGKSISLSEWLLEDGSQIINFRNNSNEWILNAGNCVESDSGIDIDSFGNSYRVVGVNNSDGCFSYNSSTNILKNVTSCYGSGCYLKEYYCEDYSEEIRSDYYLCLDGCSNGICTTSSSVSGCVLPNGSIVSIGSRLISSGKYCDSDNDLKVLKVKGVSCSSSYECSSNICSSGKCVESSVPSSSNNASSSNSSFKKTDNSSGVVIFWSIFMVVLILGVILAFLMWTLHNNKKYDNLNKTKKEGDNKGQTIVKKFPPAGSQPILKGQMNSNLGRPLAK